MRGPAADPDSAPARVREAAHDCFARYGYQKTTVADLARGIGFSKAYIYRFFESKQAIGGAICTDRLDRIVAEARKSMEEGGSATDRFRRMFPSVTALSAALLFNDGEIYEVAAPSALEQ